MALKTCFTLLHNSQHSSSRTFSQSPLSILLPAFFTMNLTTTSCVYQHFLLRGSSILLFFVLSSNLSNTSGALLMAQELDLELQRYTDSKEGFTLLIPSSWTKVDKAGATALFQDAIMGSNNIGIVVKPVRLANLGDFGSPEFVAVSIYKQKGVR
ncbi:uncharacterized protein LOC107462693 [Arachis duranensis]|uniref:Uncharacterized protein LOC107462693 n=1 Tax=Arachis duranensis TaxID=130453 RepID=A0A6P4BXE1_ARADU|nr:uncharacterized protein LOC107462693 [Arachis duranensis]